MISILTLYFVDFYIGIWDLGFGIWDLARLPDGQGFGI